MCAVHWLKKLSVARSAIPCEKWSEKRSCRRMQSPVIRVWRDNGNHKKNDLFNIIFGKLLETPTRAAQSRSLALIIKNMFLCDTSVSKCFKSVAKVFQSVSKGCQKRLKALHKRYKSVTKALHKRYKSVTKVFQSVSNALQTCFKVFRGCCVTFTAYVVYHTVFWNIYFLIPLCSEMHVFHCWELWCNSVDASWPGCQVGSMSTQWAPSEHQVSTKWVVKWVVSE